MARYQHLPIFLSVYKLNMDIDKRVSNFSRYHKYSIGSELRNECREILKILIFANNAVEKTPSLTQMRDRIEYLKVLIRMAYETGAFQTGRKAYLSVSEQAIDIARQTEGWIKSQSKV